MEEKDKEKEFPKAGLAEEILKGNLEEEKKFEGPDRLFKFADTLKQDSSKDDAKEKEIIETWVFFIVGKECFGLPVSCVQEILRVENITHVPHAPDVVKGITNMRGKVLPVIDMSKRLGLGEGIVTEQSRILVVTMKDRLFGLLVDAVKQVIRISKKNIQPPPQDIMTIKSDYIIGVYNTSDNLVIMLDLKNLLMIKE